MKIKTNPFILKYKTDRQFKAGVSLGFSLVTNIAFSVFKCCYAVIYKSRWFSLSAGYYFLLSVLKAALFTAIVNKNLPNDKIHKICRGCGSRAVFLSTFFSAMSYLLIRNDYVIRYPKYAIYLSALFTFYNLCTAIKNVFTYKNSKNPVLYAAKKLNTITASVSLFFLQTAMLAEFGMGEIWEERLNIFTGLLVYIITLVLSVSICRNSDKYLKKRR